MTAIVATRKKFGNKTYVCFGSDTLITRNNEIELARNNHKFIEYTNFTVLFCGVVSVQTVLEEFKRKKSLKVRKFMQMKDKGDVHDFAATVTKMLKEKLDELGGSGSDGADDFALIIVTKDKLYETDKYAFVCEHDCYISDGSGKPYMDGVLLSGYDRVSSPEELFELTYKCVETATRLNITCGGNIVVKWFCGGKNK